MLSHFLRVAAVKKLIEEIVRTMNHSHNIYCAMVAKPRQTFIGMLCINYTVIDMGIINFIANIDHKFIHAALKISIMPAFSNDMGNEYFGI